MFTLNEDSNLNKILPNSATYREHQTMSECIAIMQQFSIEPYFD